MIKNDKSVCEKKPVLSVKEKEAKNTPKQRDNYFWYEKLKNYTNSLWYAGWS